MIKKMPKAVEMECQLRIKKHELTLKNEEIKYLKKSKEELEEILHKMQVQNMILIEDMERAINDLVAAGNFPVILQDGLILNISKANKKPFYDSTWLIKVLNKNGDFGKRIIKRPDDETLFNLVQLVSKMGSLKEIRELDMGE